MISPSTLSTPKVRILGVYLNGECFTKKELFLTKRKRRDRITVNHTTHQHMQEDSLLWTENGSRSWDGTILVSGFGEEKTLNYHSRCGCVEVAVFGFLAAAFHMFTEATHAPPVALALLLTNSRAYPLLLGIISVSSKYGLMMSTKNSSTQENLWLGSSIWVMYLNSW